MRTSSLRIGAMTLIALLLTGLLPVVAFAAVPDTTADTATVAEDGSVNIDVLANDSTDAGALLITNASASSHGTVAIAGGGTSIDYSPDANYHGPDSFTYVATNDDGDSAPTTVSITVTSVNDPPNAVADSKTVAEDSGATTIDVLANDTDADTTDTLTITGTSNPAHGTVVVAGDGSDLTYQPDANYHGPDSFTYNMSDGHGGTDSRSEEHTSELQSPR